MFAALALTFHHRFTADRGQQSRNTSRHAQTGSAAPAGSRFSLNTTQRVFCCFCFLFFFPMLAGFASFPASDSQSKVPRPMSVNPFTVSSHRGELSERPGCLWCTLPSLTLSLLCLTGERLPQSRDIEKSFHLTPPPPPFLTSL